MKSKDQRRFEKYEKMCKKLTALNDNELAICLTLIGFKRIVKYIDSYNKNYEYVSDDLYFTVKDCNQCKKHTLKSWSDQDFAECEICGNKESNITTSYTVEFK